MLPLWGTRPLGKALPKEGHSVASSFQHLSKTRIATTSTRRPWSGLQPWKGEPLGGQINPECSGRGNRYVSNQILSSKSTSATHSFVSTSWVEAHNILIESMIPPLRVNSVGGKVQFDKMCLNLRIEIRGIDLPANLVVMGTRGLDVILGMNWLHRNQATVSCDKRTVKLVSPSRKEVVAELYMPELEEGACHYLSVDSKEANLIDDIRIVSKFVEVFPEEL
jgi:hypothetical protein